MITQNYFNFPEFRLVLILSGVKYEGTSKKFSENEIRNFSFEVKLKNLEIHAGFLACLSYDFKDYLYT